MCVPAIEVEGCSKAATVCAEVRQDVWILGDGE